MDEAELSAQWLDVYPRAQRLMKHDAESGNKNKDAWRLALQRLSLARGGHPTAALRSALVQYLVFGASSSGVEQDFSKLHLGLGYVRGSALPSTEEFAAKAILDARHQEDKVRLVRLARITWTSCFGQARAASAQERLDKGLKKRKQEEHDEGLDTEAAFLRKRRRAELAAASADAPLAEASSSEEEDLVNQLWTDKHQAELEFQQKKLRQRKIQALAENVLLENEKDDGLARDMENCRRNLLQREAERRRKFLARMRLEACRSPTELQADLRGKKNLFGCSGHPPAATTAFQSSHHGAPVRSRSCRLRAAWQVDRLSSSFAFRPQGLLRSFCSLRADRARSCTEDAPGFRNQARLACVLCLRSPPAKILAFPA